MPKFGMARSRWMLAAWPTGDTSPGPCQAVRTAKNSHSAATFRAMVRAPASTMSRARNLREAGTRKVADQSLYFREGFAGGVQVGFGGIAAFAAQELVHGEPGPLAETAPGRLVHATQSVAEHGAVAPVG